MGLDRVNGDDKKNWRSQEINQMKHLWFKAKATSEVYSKKVSWNDKLDFATIVAAGLILSVSEVLTHAIGSNVIYTLYIDKALLAIVAMILSIRTIYSFEEKKETFEAAADSLNKLQDDVGILINSPEARNSPFYVKLEELNTVMFNISLYVNEGIKYGEEIEKLRNNLISQGWNGHVQIREAKGDNSKLTPSSKQEVATPPSVGECKTPLGSQNGDVGAAHHGNNIPEEAGSMDESNGSVDRLLSKNVPASPKLVSPSREEQAPSRDSSPIKEDAYSKKITNARRGMVDTLTSVFSSLNISTGGDGGNNWMDSEIVRIKEFYYKSFAWCKICSDLSAKNGRNSFLLSSTSFIAIAITIFLPFYVSGIIVTWVITTAKAVAAIAEFSNKYFKYRQKKINARQIGLIFDWIKKSSKSLVDIPSTRDATFTDKERYLDGIMKKAEEFLGSEKDRHEEEMKNIVAAEELKPWNGSETIRLATNATTNERLVNSTEVREKDDDSSDDIVPMIQGDGTSDKKCLDERLNLLAHQMCDLASGAAILELHRHRNVPYGVSPSETSKSTNFEVASSFPSPKL